MGVEGPKEKGKGGKKVIHEELLFGFVFLKSEENSSKFIIVSEFEDSKRWEGGDGRMSLR